MLAAVVRGEPCLAPAGGCVCVASSSDRCRVLCLLLEYFIYIALPFDLSPNLSPLVR
jgi:hypothetical protein